MRMALLVYCRVVFIVCGLLIVCGRSPFFQRAERHTFALNDVDHVLGATIGTVSHLENLSGHCATDCPIPFYVDTCLAAWLLTLPIPCVGGFLLLGHKPPSLKGLSNCGNGDKLRARDLIALFLGMVTYVLITHYGHGERTSNLEDQGGS